MCLNPLIQLSAKLKSCRPQSVRGAFHGNVKRQIDVIFLTHPSIKISVVMNAYLAVKNVDMSFQHNVKGFNFKPTHPPRITICVYLNKNSYIKQMRTFVLFIFWREK